MWKNRPVWAAFALLRSHLRQTRGGRPTAAQRSAHASPPRTTAAYCWLRTCSWHWRVEGGALGSEPIGLDTPCSYLLLWPVGSVPRRGGQTDIKGWKWSSVVDRMTDDGSTGLALSPLFCSANPAPTSSRSAFQLTETNSLTWDATVRLLPPPPSHSHLHCCRVPCWPTSLWSPLGACLFRLLLLTTVSTAVLSGWRQLRLRLGLDGACGAGFSVYWSRRLFAPSERAVVDPESCVCVRGRHGEALGWVPTTRIISTSSTYVAPSSLVSCLVWCMAQT